MSTIRKALTAGVFALLAALGASMLDGDLTTAEAIVAAGMALVTGSATWTVPNARHRKMSRRDPRRPAL